MSEIDLARVQVLRKYHVSPEMRLSAGMEAEVFARDAQTVVKLYAGTARLADLLTLQAFYESLDRSRLPFALPRIRTAAQEGAFVVTVEQRLGGERLSERLPGLDGRQLDGVMRRYLEAGWALSQLEAPVDFLRYKLFDPLALSLRATGDWHGFLARFIDHQLGELTAYLERDVTQFPAKMTRLSAILRQPYTGAHRLIHGDFFPGNLLVDESLQVTALLDFGLFTMYGDPLFDLATGWVFFDMYDELRVQARARYLDLLLERLGEEARGRLYRYVLIYSLLSANTYSSQCADGHYQWCVANLNHAPFWEAIA